ncbi:hypothetical protein BD410DRAFT_102550 [Rickenella mellea]|uniref:Uncharacterized protein n=1 Tax=Rickenella mellea TaxID=50990 RepID=A0A4Y7PMG3_9AGAM|nr:hypothetical protein BD410DRAFT_102550 [Rickenella mellea]
MTTDPPVHEISQTTPFLVHPFLTCLIQNVYSLRHFRDFGMLPFCDLAKVSRRCPRFATLAQLIFLSPVTCSMILGLGIRCKTT